MITFYDLNELIEQLKKEKVKIVRIQYFARINVVTIFNIDVTARAKETMRYEEQIGMSDPESTRRLNKMKLKAIDREQVIKKILEKKGFEVRKGVYENVE